MVILTPQQLQVLALSIDYSAAEIAGQLGVSVRRVKYIKQRIKRVFGLGPQATTDDMLQAGRRLGILIK